eukprot:763043_1
MQFRNVSLLFKQFSSSLTKHRTDVAQLSGDLNQLENVSSVEGSGKEAGELPKFNAPEAGLKARDIADNIHTFLSQKDDYMPLSVLYTFIQRNAKLINEHFLLKHCRG